MSRPTNDQHDDSLPDAVRRVNVDKLLKTYDDQALECTAERLILRLCDDFTPAESIPTNRGTPDA